jgi:hypothetical protein
MESAWLYWINESIFLDKGVTNIMKRKHAYSFFCKNGLVPFLKSHGYIFEGSTTELTTKLLRLLFHSWKGYHVQAISQNCDFEEEQYELYCHKVDSQQWDRFWKSWEGFQDFESGAFGYPFQMSLPTFCWSWLNLYISPAAESLHRELEEILREEEAAKGRDDPYLQETHMRDYQDRHWH